MSGKIDKKTFVMLSRFWLLSEWGVWANPLKKGNLQHESFSGNIE